uniref:Tubulin/FtsZ GTPase domain-containing protein n=1 Tax=Odontella aurita TaxID=265563 RepID=A0A7S4NHZ4_9STRA
MMLSVRALCGPSPRRLLLPLASSLSSASAECALRRTFGSVPAASARSNTLRPGSASNVPSAAFATRWQSSAAKGGDSLSKRAARALGANKKSSEKAAGNKSEKAAPVAATAADASETVEISGSDEGVVAQAEAPPRLHREVTGTSEAADEGKGRVASSEPFQTDASSSPPPPPPPPQASQVLPHQPGHAPPHPPQSAHVHLHEFAPRIVVCGVGGAGGNAVNNMIARGLSGVDFIALNTDAQHLATSLTDNRLQIGTSLTSGLGCGANPDAGRLAAEESRDHIAELLGDAHMVFVAAGMGGGTGTGAAPVVAEVCYNLGILTVGVVTKPFRFEGTHRMRLADEGIRRLTDVVDTLILVPNQNLFKLAADKTSFVDACTYCRFCSSRIFSFLVYFLLETE